jgi:uncharacterized repeat protein (TIGR01451 family)
MTMIELTSNPKSSLHGIVKSLLLAGFVFALLLAVATVGAGSAAAATAPGTGWQLLARSYPTYLQPGSSGTIRVDVVNTGAVASNGAVTVTDTLPEGVEATESGADFLNEIHAGEGWECTGTTVVSCTNSPSEMPSLAAGGVTQGKVEGKQELPIGIAVHVKEGAALQTSQNEITISGGGAVAATTIDQPLTIAQSSLEAGFGFNNFAVWLTNANGTPDTQAGSHPYEMTVAFDLNSNKVSPGNTEEEAKNVELELPPGLIGNPSGVPRCPRQEFDAKRCSADTQIGFAAVYTGEEEQPLPLYNLAPPPGEPALFGYTLVGKQAFIETHVRSGGDYGLTERIPNIPQLNVISSIVSIWGVPAEASHNPFRKQPGCQGGGCSPGISPAPFLTLPTACTEQTARIHATPWQDESLSAERTTPIDTTGCDRLNFGPAITALPETTAADTPTGLTAEVKVSQEGLDQVEGLAASDLEDTTVVLPAGVGINPGQAAGLAACQESQANIGVEEAPAACPKASKVGVDEIETPLLAHSLKGNVYVLQSNPPNLKLLVVAEGEGVELKLVGKVSLCEAQGETLDGKSCEAPGQLIASFEETPELPFTDFKLSFSGGAQAALTTPATCGTYTSSTSFTPWSAGLPEALDVSTFTITGGTGGAACPSSPLPFNPTLTAGATTDQAGGYTDFSLLLQRADDQQRVSTLSFKTPPGLLGMISKVPLCGEADANAGTCPASSHIGHTVVEAGPGPYPLVVPQPGQPPAAIYLTGGYKGAPYGLSIVVPLVVGPFTLQTQVVRAKIEVDPHTAQLTITTDALPQIIDGIPTDLRTINAVIDREGFMFNPTNCDPQSFSGTATGSEGASAPISSHFQVGSCQSLKFQPKFAVSTPGHTSKTDGAGLTATLTYPKTAQGTEADIAKVKVDLPKQLPSRLTTLQKACTNAQFEVDYEGCPKASKIGYAKVNTPLLPVPLEGPAIFVSHGGEAFPSLTIVLKGYGVTIDLVGTTFISHAGITSTTFNTVPDVPFSTFTLTLSQGPYSALAANLPAKDHGNFCGQTLSMPTAFIAQNGAEIHESTAIAVTGCSPEIKVTSQKIKGKTATIAVSVPAAGKLVASGKGLSKGSDKTSKAGTVTVKLTLTTAELARLSKHPGRKLRAKVTLKFTPKTGAGLKTTTTVLVG